MTIYKRAKVRKIEDRELFKISKLVIDSHKGLEIALLTRHPIYPRIILN